MDDSKFLLTFLLASLLLAGVIGCGPQPQSGGQGPSGGSTANAPELTDAIIHERINDTWVREVPPEGGSGDTISWGFDEDEPKEITVVEKQVEGTKATIVLDIKTRSSKYARNQRELAGRVRTEWELRTGWALRRWEIRNTENISFKYKNLPKPPEQNANQ
jgi:hypothetical protein